MRLPTQVRETAERSWPYAIISSAERTQYGINLATWPDCVGEDYCTSGYFFIRLTSESQEPLEGEIIPLTQNITGYFLDYICHGRGCSYARIFWDQGEYRYYIGIEAGKRDVMINLANSAIENPVIESFPETPRPSQCL